MGAARTDSACWGPPTTPAVNSVHPARTARRRRRSARPREYAGVTRLPAMAVASMASAGLVTGKMPAEAEGRSATPAPMATSVDTVSVAAKREPRLILRQGRCRTSRRAAIAWCATPPESARTTVASAVARMARPAKPVTRPPVACSTPASRDAAAWRPERALVRVTARVRSAARRNAHRECAGSTAPGSAARVGTSAARAAANASAASRSTAAMAMATCSNASRGLSAARLPTAEPSAERQTAMAAPPPSSRPCPRRVPTGYTNRRRRPRRRCKASRRQPSLGGNVLDFPDPDTRLLTPAPR
jgi:hypothetical protein